MRSSAFAFLAAPLCLGLYGVIRILDGLDGSRGPGLAWTAGHLVFLVGLGFFAHAFRTMWTIAGRGRLATAGFLAGLAGELAVGVQFGIDLVVGFGSADRAGMDASFARIQDVPGVDAAFYSYGPLLFFAGQLVLVTLLALRRRVKPWAPVLVLAEIVLPLLDKDFIPLGAALLLVAFAPLLRGAVPQSTSDPVGSGRQGRGDVGSR
ncbi:hypothetical protein AMES_1398 [Amycolatopsis mediterranei S699]|uniref:Integral membrane protein n=2 Tax=Amycolatopsis mediterranei TaxID=33910 RepID=A0A0H3D157_AMYMU|nr:hypothetical protein [Amycolatopsis mediterranei]ADJ43221.1 hypothetical protein AMED_1407 [Amycolatopsis mediterranei U32]AEK39918.1 hypothetical protein RAM_07130 [Amycolatopsis mediterranei S699]AFO74934.1 hypothetical protein AMES_1398 [Amycolatopsis mediterranei S699]AGT82063.1 hypothetical protein B737_1399 [Amycolatopsis mediterranei RB]KDO05133.1 hypothetical protein DV26_41035 [Amycolatopsis mediterranei]